MHENIETENKLEVDLRKALKRLVDTKLNSKEVELGPVKRLCENV